MKKILVVEDEEPIREGLFDFLSSQNYKVDTASDGIEAEKKVEKEKYDLIILDLMLPNKDGYTLCEEWRRTGHNTPVLMLTAKSTEDNIIQGLKIGADDYVTKPFSLKELLARIEAVLRRSRFDGNFSEHLEFAGGKVDFETMKFVKGKYSTGLTDLDIRIIRLFEQNKGRTISRQELLERIWGLEHDNIWTRTVDMAVAKIRKKISPEGNGGKIIKTVRSAGYLYGK